MAILAFIILLALIVCAAIMVEGITDNEELAVVIFVAGIFYCLIGVFVHGIGANADTKDFTPPEVIEAAKEKECTSVYFEIDLEPVCYKDKERIEFTEHKETLTFWPVNQIERIDKYEITLPLYRDVSRGDIFYLCNKEENVTCLRGEIAEVDISK